MSKTMMYKRKYATVALGGMCLLGLVITPGCQTSSRKTVRTYEYSNEPRPARQSQREREPQSESDWEMVSPGEMVVDPGRN